jgi:hypothetical protein
LAASLLPSPRFAFGGGYASRALFTNDERSVIFAQRPVILVGIDDFVKRGDLRDRSVFLNLAPIPRTGRLHLNFACMGSPSTSSKSAREPSLP